MYIYGDKYRPVRAWNAVNVPGEKGFLRHGNVINVVDGGLIVDFGCPSQRSEFVEYGKIFDINVFPFAINRPECHTGDPEFIKNGAIEALIRVRPDQPWTWRPGKLLECDFCTPDRLVEFALVEVQMEGDTARELLPDSQIRLPFVSFEDFKQKKHVIGEEHFMVRSCSLPKYYWSSISSILSSLCRRDLEHQYQALGISVSSDRLTYLQRFSDKPIRPEQLEKLFNECKEKTASYDQGGRDYLNRDWLCRRTLTKSRPKKSQGSRKVREFQLPVELLVEVFRCLDSIDRLRCRRTCALWNLILSKQSTFTDVWVSFGEKSFSASPDYEWDPFYAVIGCLLHCINNHTQRIVITDVELDASTEDLMDLIGPLMQSARMKQVIFCDSKFSSDYCRNMEMAMYFTAKSCDRFDVLTFKNCRLAVDAHEYKFDVDVVLESVKPSAPDAAIQMWDLVERNCRVVDPKWTAERIESLMLSDTISLIKVLKKFQSCDSRPTSHYRGMKWTEEEIKRLDVSKLTPVTRCAFFFLD